MFAKMVSFNWCTVLLCYAIGMSTAAPFRRVVRMELNLKRELQSLTPGAEIPPSLVDLQDQYENLSQQLVASTAGTPDFDELTNDVNLVKQTLDEQMKGVAVFVNATTSADPLPTPTASTTVVNPGTASATSSTEPSTTTSPLSSSAAKNAPPITVVTQEGTPIVVVASHTNIPASATPTNPAGTVAPASASSNNKSPATGTQSSATTKSTAPKATGGSGTAIAAQAGEVGNGALSSAPSSLMLVTAVLGTLIML